jgi:hypothetical protein
MVITGIAIIIKKKLRRKKTELLHTFSFSLKKKNIMYRTINHLAYVLRVDRENITRLFLF